MADKKKKPEKNIKDDQAEVTAAEGVEPEEGETEEEGPDEKKEASQEAGKEEPLSKEEETWQEQYTRLMADFQNYKKRTEKEKADVYSFANEKIMTDLLQVVDNFERALESDTEDEAYREGMKMILRQLLDIMEAAGLEEIEAKGEEFDPNFHHAVMQDKNEEFGPGIVTEVLQKGYTLNGKVIRPSMVKVNE